MKTYITFTEDKKTGKIWEHQHKDSGVAQARKSGRQLAKQEKHKYLTTKVLRTN